MELQFPNSFQSCIMFLSYPQAQWYSQGTHAQWNKTLHSGNYANVHICWTQTHSACQIQIWQMNTVQPNNLQHSLSGMSHNYKLVSFWNTIRENKADFKPKQTLQELLAIKAYIMGRRTFLDVHKFAYKTNYLPHF